MMGHPAPTAPVEALLEELHNLLCSDTPSQYQHADIDAYQKLLSTCVQNCLLQATSLRPNEPLHKDMVRGASMTVGLLRAATLHLPEIFVHNVSGGDAASDSSNEYKRSKEAPPLSGPVYLSQIYAPVDVVKNDRFDTWLLSGLINLLAIPAFGEYHGKLVEVVAEIFYLMKEAEGESHIALFRDLRNLANALQEPKTFGMPYPAKLLILSNLEDENRAQRRSATGPHQVVLTGLHALNVLLSNSYRVFHQLIDHLKFDLFDELYHLWALFVACLELPAVRSTLAVMEESYKLLHCLYSKTRFFPIRSHERVSLLLLHRVLATLSPAADEGSITTIPYSAALDDIIVGCLRSIRDQMALDFFVAASPYITKLVHPHVFSKLPSLQLRRILLELYAKTLRLSGRMKPNIAIALLDYTASAELRDAVTDCFHAVISPRPQYEHSDIALPSRKRKHPQASLDSENCNENDSSMPPKRLKLSGEGRATSTPICNPRLNSIEQPCVEPPQEDVTNLVSERAAGLIRKAVVAENSAREDTSGLNGMASVFRRQRAELPMSTITSTLQLAIGTVLDGIIALVTPGSSMQSRKSERCELLLSRACDVGALVSSGAVWPQQCVWQLLWILSIPWTDAAINVGQTGLDARGATYERAHEEFLALHNSIDFPSTRVDPMHIASLSTCVSDAGAARCLDVMVQLLVTADNMPLDEWLVFTVLTAMSSQRTAVCSAACKLLPLIAYQLNQKADLIERFLELAPLHSSIPHDHMSLLFSALGFFACASAGSLTKKGDGNTMHSSSIVHCPLCEPPQGDRCVSSKSVEFRQNKLQHWARFVQTANRSAQVEFPFFRSIKRAFNHADVRELNMSSPVGQACLNGLHSESRPARLAAGNAIRILVERIEYSTEDIRLLASNNKTVLVNAMTGLQKVKNAQLQETAITTIGQIGCVANEGLLLAVLYYLIDRIGYPNTLVNALAWARIHAIAAAREVTVHKLFEPYWGEISIQLLDRSKTEPLIYSKVLQLVGMTPKSFLEKNLHYILPHLVMQQDTDRIKDIAQVLGQEMSYMLGVEGSILPFILMQSKEPNIPYLLDLIAPTRIETLVTSNGLLITQKLTLELGDNRSAVREKAESNLLYVKTILIKYFQESGAIPRGDESVCAFLQVYILGILDNINKIVLDLDRCRVMDEKRKAIRSLSEVIRLMGPHIVSSTPQVLATLQSIVEVPSLRDVGIDAWERFIRTLEPSDVGSLLNQVCISLSKPHADYTTEQMARVVAILEYLFIAHRGNLRQYLAATCFLPDRAEFSHFNVIINECQGSITLVSRITRLLPVISDDNATIARRALIELRAVLVQASESFYEDLHAENEETPLNNIISTLLETCRRYNGVDLENQVLCCECLGALGAVDPSRLNMVMTYERSTVEILNNEGDFASHEQAVAFVCQLIARRLAPACRSARDITMQSNYAFAIQELLRFCGFTKDIVDRAVPTNGKGRNNESEGYLWKYWMRFSAAVRTTIRPLLNAKYHKQRINTSLEYEYPLFPKQETFRDWLTMWTMDLIKSTSGERALRIFALCRDVVKIGDLNIAQFIIPHVVLNILISNDEKQRDHIYCEFMAVLEDASNGTTRAVEKRHLGSQTMFSLIDHLTRWLRLRRHHIAKQKAAQARRQGRYLDVEKDDVDVDPPAQKVEQLLARIPQALMADASYRCKAYARALLHFEQHVRQERADKDEAALQPLYAKLQKIYAHLDEPDGMEGISAKFLTPTLEQQILEHESAGRWTAAQTCYEVSLQRDPSKLVYHIGLMNCSKNLGHMETLLAHVEGIVPRHPEWSRTLNAHAIEAAWRLGDWNSLERLLLQPYDSRFETSVGALLLSARQGKNDQFREILRGTYESLTAELVAASMESYRRAYDCAIKLHMLHEIETIVRSGTICRDGDQLLRIWDRRLKCTTPSFRVREPILNLRRILLQEPSASQLTFATTLPSRDSELGIRALKCGAIWLQTAKISRKAGHLQPAYNAILQATYLQAPQVHIEKAKWLWEQRQTHKAMFELRAVLQKMGGSSEGASTGSSTSTNQNSVATQTLASERFMKAKTQLLLTRWMEETSGCHSHVIIHKYQAASKELEWEKSVFFLGRYYNKLYDNETEKQKLSKRASGAGHAQLANLALLVCRQYGKALTYGTRYIYQTMPRLLTLWFNMGQIPATMDPNHNGKDERVAKFQTINRLVRKLNERLPAYQFLTAIPQLASRIGHANVNVHQVLESILVNVLCVYPHQTLWQLLAVARSSSKLRAQRMNAVFHKAKSDPAMRQLSQGGLAELIQEGERLTGHLLELCNHPVQQRETTLSVSRYFRNLERIAPLRMIVPLQSTMTVVLPSTSQMPSQSSTAHRPFPLDAPTIYGFHDEVEVMNSLQRPRKLAVKGSDGKDYMFLCKPKDDLRKDCRLMEFNSMINKLLKKDPDARKRNLYIRTYAVIPLNEECGLIEWVKNTIGFRHIMVQGYKTKGIYCMPQEVKQIMERKHPSPEEIFVDTLRPRFPPIFHEWFLETFPEPTQWLASRLAYSSTTAVMSMIGHVVGLGDRHGENILFDDQTGDCVHVDLNCLFEKGLTFEKPEKVPFRLTHNMVDAFGVTGVEGVFRKSCEVTMRVLRSNRESLMSVLETFLYDPLWEWNKAARRAGGSVTRDEKGEVENEQAIKTLQTISRKLLGFIGTSGGLALSVEGQVHELIDQATDVKNLAAMYIGWTAYM